MTIQEPEKLRLFLSKVHLKGFKSIEDVTIDFQKGLNILIGKNGSGKSNFLECLNHIFTYFYGSQALYNFARLEFKSQNNKSLVWETERLNNNTLNANDGFFQDKIFLKEKLLVDSEEIYNNVSENLKYLGAEIDISDEIRRNIPIGLRKIISQKAINSLSPKLIKYNIPINLECLDIPGRVEFKFGKNEIQGWPQLRTLGIIMSIFMDSDLYDLENLKKTKVIDRSKFYKKLKIQSSIKENLKKYTPIEDIRFNENINIYNDNKSILIENLRIDFKMNNSWMPWSQLSDGSKRLFYIIAELSDWEHPLFSGRFDPILIEEPELGIHPHQFHLLMQFLKEESENKQIIISTHSPQALNYLSENELSNILITYYDLKKGTQIKHLTSTQKAKAKKYMKEVGFLSDYWTLSDLEP